MNYAILHITEKYVDHLGSMIVGAYLLKPNKENGFEQIDLPASELAKIIGYWKLKNNFPASIEDAPSTVELVKHTIQNQIIERTGYKLALGEKSEFKINDKSKVTRNVYYLEMPQEA